MLLYKVQKTIRDKLLENKPVTKLKVLGIAGSPRRDGNTDHLLNQVMAGASSQGAETKTVVLSELNIAPCRHCDGCIKTGKCVVDDDMQWLHIDLREADRIVLASPIFFMGVTAQTKAMIDRCQALWVIKYVLKLPVAINPGKERKGIFVSVGGTKLRNLFKPALATVKSWFTTLDIKYAGELVFSGIDESESIHLHPTALKDAFSIGQKLAAGNMPQ
jgi:NAD(P)H-dependent FMN reductase